MCNVEWTLCVVRSGCYVCNAEWMLCVVRSGCDVCNGMCVGMSGCCVTRFGIV